MVDAHGSAAQRIDVLEKRLASLHDLGVDTVGLRSQLAFARTHLAEGRVDDVLSMCDDIEATARRLAEGSSGEQRVRTGRFTRDQLAEAIKDILGGGLFGKLMAEHRGGPDLRLEARLRDMDDHIRLQMASEADALRAEQQILREEIEQMRRAIGSAPATANAPADLTNDEAAVAGAATPSVNPNKEPLWAARLHSILVKAIRRADAQATQIAAIVQQFMGNSSNSMAPAVDALRSGMSEDLKQLLAERMPIIADHEPSWISPLVQSLQAVADRLQVQPSRQNEATARTASANRAEADAHDHQPTDVIHAHASSAAVEPSGMHVAALPKINEENNSPVHNQLSASTSDWTTPLITSLQAIVERLQAPVVPVSAADEPAWTAPLVASLQAVAERVQIPSVVSDVPVSEPAWVAALIGNLQAMADRLPTGAVGQSEHPTDLATALGAVVERGLEGLGELIRQGQQSGSQAMRPVDDTSAALSPVTIAKQEDGTTRVFGQSSTRTNKIPVQITPALSDSLRSLVLHEIEARLGQTSIVTAKDLKPDQVRAIVAAEFDRRAGGAIERNDINDLRANLIRLLPNLLEEESVRQQLFAVLALEAISKPGALAELTGLRSFLKRELNKAATEIADRLQTT